MGITPPHSTLPRHEERFWHYSFTTTGSACVPTALLATQLGIFMIRAALVYFTRSSELLPYCQL